MKRPILISLMVVSWALAAHAAGPWVPQGINTNGGANTARWPQAMGTNEFSADTAIFGTVTITNEFHSPSGTVGNLVITNNIHVTTNWGWDDLRVPITSVKATGGLNPPGWEAWTNTLYLYSFSGTKTEEAWFTAQVPHTWRVGSELHVHVHFNMGISTSTNGVVWALDCLWASTNAVFSGAIQTMKGTNSPPGTPMFHMQADIGNLNGTGKSTSSMLVCRIYRQHNDPGDTNTDDAWLQEIDFHYQIELPTGEQGVE